MEPDVVAVAPRLVLAVILLTLDLDDDATRVVEALVLQEVEHHDVGSGLQLDLLHLRGVLVEGRQCIVLRLHLLESRRR